MKVILMNSEVHGQLSKLEASLWERIQFLAQNKDNENQKFKDYIEENCNPDSLYEIVQKMRAVYQDPNYVIGTVNL